MRHRFSLDQRLRICNARPYVGLGHPRVRLEDAWDAQVFGEMFKHELDRYARAFYDGLAGEYRRIRDNSVLE